MKKLKRDSTTHLSFLKTISINLFFFLGKGVYPDEYMDDWEKFTETALHEKEDFYSNLNMEDIADADYIYEKLVCKDFRKLRLKICH